MLKYAFTVVEEHQEVPIVVVPVDTPTVEAAPLGKTNLPTKIPDDFLNSQLSAEEEPRHVEEIPFYVIDVNVPRVVPE